MNHEDTDALKIGVDVRSLTHPLTGVGQYTLNALKYLLASKHQWFLYAHGRILPKLPKAPNIHLRTMQMHNKLAALIWSQSVLPFQIAKDKLDIFWTSKHQLPIISFGKTRKVITIHDLVWKTHPETMYFSNFYTEKLLFPFAVRAADAIITDSKTTANDLISAYPFCASKTNTMYLANVARPKPQNFEALIPYNIHKNYILFIGTIEPRKNLLRLIHAYRALPKNLRDQYQVVLAGQYGWGEKKLTTTIKQKKLEQNVILTGYVDEQTAATLMEHATLLAMPSLNEGFGLPLLEAMVQHTPILTSKVSAMAEVCQDAAVLVDPLSVKGIHDGLIDLLTDPDLRKKLIKKGVERAAEFSWENTTQQILQLFEKLAKE